MCKQPAKCLTAMAALVLSGSLALAGDKTRFAAAEQADAQPVTPAKSVTLSKAAAALEVAADLGVIDAQLKLARMYAAGTGVPRSHVKAFNLYQRIVDDNVEMRPHNAKADGVARAFVALGNYYRTGIPGSTIKTDKRRATSLLWHAASYLGDAEAQCNLAQMYLDGEGVTRNARLAINWLTNAAKKRHAKSQALLGELLWHGAKDVRRQPLKGLAMLSLARQNARNTEDAGWIDALYAGAYAGSQTDVRDRAAELAARWQPRMGRVDAAVSTPEEASVKTSPAISKDAGEKKPEPSVSAGFTNVGMDGAGAAR